MKNREKSVKNIKKISEMLKISEKKSKMTKNNQKC